MTRPRTETWAGLGAATLAWAVLAVQGCSGDEQRYPEDEPLPGRWKRARWATIDERIAELEAIGYAAGSNPAGDRMNVTVHDRERAFQGMNLYVSGHAPEAILMNMDGEVLHRWHYSYRNAVPDDAVAEMEKGLFRDFWRRAHLFENGDLLAIFEGHALIKLDAESKLLWTFQGKPHHDLFVTDDERIFVLTRKARVIPRINEDEPVLEDFISVLDSDGGELKRVSVLECFERSEFASSLDEMPDEGDVLHTNTLELVDERLAGRIPGVESGHLLISCLFIDTIAVVDLESEKVVWALSESWRWQHQPTALDDGNMLLLDNLGGSKGFGESRVIELDPVTGEFSWVYEGQPEAPFHTRTCGSCQRLPNGNTLITESDNGRAFEVREDGEIVWEFLSPHRAGPDDRLVATLFEVIRLRPDLSLSWINEDD